MVAGGVGGGYGAIVRLMARHLGKHIPGHPRLIVQNNSARGGLLVEIQKANWLRNGDIRVMLQGALNPPWNWCR